MMELTEQDYKNALALISKAPIVGSDAITVAILVQKFQAKIAEIQGGYTPPVTNPTIDPPQKRGSQN